MLKWFWTIFSLGAPDLKESSTMQNYIYTLTQRRIYKFRAILTRTRGCQQLQTFWEQEQASTRLKFASKSSNGKILRAVKNFNGPFTTPIFVLHFLGFSGVKSLSIWFYARPLFGAVSWKKKRKIKVKIKQKKNKNKNKKKAHKKNKADKEERVFGRKRVELCNVLRFFGSCDFSSYFTD